MKLSNEAVASNAIVNDETIATTVSDQMITTMVSDVTAFDNHS